MTKDHESRRADHPIAPVFLERWSRRAMSGEEITREDLMRLFEAARWAPSSGNVQPWRMLYALRSTPQWPTFFGLLVEGNSVWAHNAAALVLFVSKSINDRTGKQSVTHSFDTGAAWGYFALQGSMLGYVVHGMQGFDYERARTELGIPEDFRVEAMIAVGRPGRRESLPPALQERERPNDRRKLAETICEGKWALPG
ncbi:MAG TPA: nitroreductase family protein [Steroidobacteraceae bacterium]|jgi:nitroreductase|nr:nitroreductase family protein [Steroidobacteraceae bacterium]